MKGKGDMRSASRLGESKLGLVIVLIALVVVVGGAVFAYNQLTQAGAAPSGATGAGIAAAGKTGSNSSADEASGAAAEPGGSAEGAGGSAGADASPATTSSQARAEAYYLKDRDSVIYTEAGTPIKLSEIAGGKPFVMNFWATWCPYCIQEMDDFQAIFNDYGDRVAFAFIDCVDGQRETVEKGASWMRDQGLSLPTYYDTEYNAVRDFGASSLPTTVVVGADGEILAVSVGAINPDRMREALDAVLGS